MRSYEKKCDSADMSKGSDGYHVIMKKFKKLPNGYSCNESRFIIETKSKTDAVKVIKRMHSKSDTRKRRFYEQKDWRYKSN